MADRTYDWNGNKDIPMARPDLSDLEVARKVRMLMRDQLNHEFICTLSRDRIMTLSKELAIAVSLLRQLNQMVGYKLTDTGSKLQDIEGAEFEDRVYAFLDRYKENQES